MRRMLCILVALCGTGLSLYAEEAARGVERYALCVGSNAGGSGRATLRYAEKDARSLLSLLGEIGGIRKEDGYLVLSPTLTQFTRAFDRIRMDRAARSSSATSSVRQEFVFYYSGHSDEEGLLLGNEHLSYANLRALIANLNADIDVVILDSCSSGAITRLKGGVKMPPFLLDESSAIKGQVYLTSASEYEAAQESDRLGASFFTYYLASGLRGAADSSADGRVTLNEAYSHAFSETLARTESTEAGPQHPSYNIKLTGSGDLVLTDIRETRTRLRLAPELLGRLTIRDRSENLIAEVLKVKKEPMDIYLPDGQYNISLGFNNNLYRASIAVHERAVCVVDMSLFSLVGRETTTRRGGADEQGEPPPPGMTAKVQSLREALGEYTYRYPAHFSVISLWPDTEQRRVKYRLSLNLLVGETYSVDGLAASSLVDIVDDDMNGLQLSGFGNLTVGDVGGVQLSTANIALGELRGIQLGAVNYLAKTGDGVQLSTVNIALGNFQGLQLGTGNYTGSDMQGCQLGVLNIASLGSGSQIGVLNLAAKAKGLQLGLVNIARENEGTPIGLISIVLKGGRTHLTTWYDEAGYSTLALYHGARRFYNIYSCGYSMEKESFEGGFGFGYTRDIGPFYIAAEILGSLYINDGTVTVVFNSSPDDSLAADELEETVATTRYRLSIGYSIREHLAVFAGLSLNVESHITWSEDDDNRTGSATFSPGVFAGLRF